MNPARIAAWFHPRGASLQATGRGGAPRITWQDVAAACAGEDLRFGWDLIQARFAGNRQSLKDSITEADRVLQVFVLPKLRRRMNDPARRRQLAAIAVTTYASRTFCVHCEGTTIDLTTMFEEQKPCSRCDGRGYREMADAEKARALDIAPQSLEWFAPILKELMVHIEAAEARVVSIVRLRLGDEVAA